MRLHARRGHQQAEQRGDHEQPSTLALQMITSQPMRFHQGAGAAVAVLSCIASSLLSDSRVHG